MKPRANLPPFVKYESICDVGELSKGGKLPRGHLKIFEKIDGGNCQIRKHDWQILPGSRASYLTGARIGNHKWFSRFTKWAYSNRSLFNLPDNLIMFGEWSGNHTLNYREEYTDRFFFIDLLDLDEKRFKDYPEAVETLVELGIEGFIDLPILAEGSDLTSSDLERILGTESDFRYGSREGVVIKNYSAEPQEFLKSYHPDFAESRRLKDGETEYLTPMRFRKAVLRILDEDDSVGKQGLSEEMVVNEVISDVVREGNRTYSRLEVLQRWRSLCRQASFKDLSHYVSK